jgi:hypothetical protein
MGIQPSPYSMTRSSVRGPAPPTRIGGCGFAAGLGQDQIGSKFTNLPWYSASSFVQISFIARMRSRRIFQRRVGFVPWFSISSSFHPPPMPNRNRPPERKSTLATSFASVIGSRSITRQMPVPTFRFFVTAKAAPAATNGSRVCEYSIGNGAPPGQGVRRLVGMCVCSGKNSDSNPRSSHALARSWGGIA